MAATGADVAADDDDDTLPLPHIPSVISLGSLPPQIDGPVSGYVRLTVHLHVENDDVEGHREWLVRVRWWGSMTTVGKGDLLRENQQLCFPVHVARDVFRRYLDDMTQLRFDVVDKVTHRVYGQSAIPIRLDDLEAVGGCQRDIEIVKRGGRNNIGGVLSLHAALLWGGDASSELPPHDGMTTAPQFQLQQPHASPRRVEGAVRVWKNKDFPQSSFLAQHVSAVIKIQRAYRRWRDMATMAHAFLDWTTDEENHMSTEDTPSFDIDLDTIQLLNDPAPPRLEQASPCKGHDVLPSPLADPHHQNTPTGDKLSWRLVLELAEPCPLHRGIEVTYLFQDTTSSLWWDSHSTALSSRNEHEYIDEGLDLLIEFALWGSGESTNPIGHATLNVSTLTKSKQEVVQLPITWTEPPLHPLLPHFSDKIASLPLRVQCAMHQKSSLAVYSPKTSNSVATSVVSSTTLLPATATICVQITSIDMLGAVSVVGWHVFFRCVVPVGVRVHPKATGSTEYDTAQGQFLSIQTSPTILLTCGKVHVEFEHHVVIHPELLEAMQEQAKDGGAVVHLYRHVMDMEILMGTVSIPLAALLYRRQGIRGAFAFDQRGR
ncbi:hypothetical protein DYB28_001904 [Aphanomyces astaci]|uniref:C2CD3 N-terminal C2 domain-containing protein n=2 Tax=Aphanomyces astaci TaxID=112090 RepID=A0A397A2Y2_APHAT|nr:hypothetical protein DYB36_001032 [Aphanomyces astaci]RHY47120.1 hypothetical protein DYB34_003299 [Aphanomyces astaci]RLO07740.1 hypothetical protein DYB28_001904 [Aphanomyces astaci]